VPLDLQDSSAFCCSSTVQCRCTASQKAGLSKWIHVREFNAAVGHPGKRDSRTTGFVGIVVASLCRFAWWKKKLFVLATGQRATLLDYYSQNDSALIGSASHRELRRNGQDLEERGASFLISSLISQTSFRKLLRAFHGDDMKHTSSALSLFQTLPNRVDEAGARLVFWWTTTNRSKEESGPKCKILPRQKTNNYPILRSCKC
jgi:hypothetical protein